jgi:hypothetical protein
MTAAIRCNVNPRSRWSRCPARAPMAQRQSSPPRKPPPKSEKDGSDLLHPCILVTAVRAGLARLTGLGGFYHFDKVAGIDVIDVAINRNIPRNERMFANAAHIINDTRPTDP